jgi:hypothetical protein
MAGSMTITLGAWAIPLAITVAACAWPVGDKNDDYGVTALLKGVGAIIISLASWLVWALLA